MAELHRFVTIAPGGQPSVVLDMADRASTAMVADTFQITPYNETAVYTQALQRYGGTKKVAEMHGNGSLAAEFYLGDGSSEAQAWGVFDDLAAILENATTQYFYEWRPEGAAVSTYFEIRGSEPYDLMYRWIEVAGTRRLHVKVTVQTAPLGQGLPMDVYDSFDADTAADYAIDADDAVLTVDPLGVGGLVPGATGESRWYYSARGYRPPDAQVTLLAATGASVAATHKTGVVVKRLDASNYIKVEMTSANQLAIVKVDGGTPTTLGTPASITVAAHTTYWVRGRIEGNTVYAEVFASTSPTPLLAPTASYSATLAGADATKFGAGVAGDQGFAVTPKGTDWSYNSFQVEPFTYRAAALPRVFALSIPGTADAEVELSVTADTTSASAAISWALVGWSPSDLSILDSSDAAGGGTVTSDAGALNGSYLSVGTGNRFATLTWSLGSMFAPDDYADETAVEVWARVAAPVGSVTPKVTAFLIAPGGPHLVGTDEFGSSGASLKLPATGSGFIWRLMRLGTLHVPADSVNYELEVKLDATNTSLGSLGLDYVLAVPVRARAAGPTAKSFGSTYPTFLPIGGVYEKIIAYDLSGRLSTSFNPADHTAIRDAGLSGSKLALPPGTPTAIVKISNLVPDDPNAYSSPEASNEWANDPLSIPATVHFGITPRYFLTRSS